MGGRRWSEDDLIYLEYFVFDNDAHLSVAAEHLGRSREAVKLKLGQLRKQDNNVAYLRRVWTEKEDFFLKRYHGKMANELIGKRLNRTTKAVERRSYRLGLRKLGNIRKFDNEIRKLISEGYYLSQVSQKLDIKMVSLYTHVKRNGIDYKTMPLKERVDNKNHPWSKQNQTSYQKYLSKKLKE